MNILERQGSGFKTNYREVLICLLLWFLLFIEPLHVGPFKISQIWKGLLIVALLLYILPRRVPNFVYVGILFSAKYLIYKYLPYGFLVALQDAMESVIFPLSLGFFYLLYKNDSASSSKLLHIAQLLSLFIIYSAVPFLFGLQSLNPTMELDAYGLAGAIATKGLFYQVAVSSKLFTISTLVLINSYGDFNANVLKKIVWFCSIVLGTWFVLTSWTRTGWFVFFGGVIISLFYEANLKQKIAGFLIVIILIVGVVWLFETNQAMRYRLVGATVYRSDVQFSIQGLANARLPFINVALDNLKQEGFWGQLLGYGTQRGIDLFEEKTGMAIISHNAIFEILESSGFLGLVLYLLFILRLLHGVKSKMPYASPQIKKLCFLAMYLFLAFFLTSHGSTFWGEIIYSCIFLSVILNKNRINC